MRTTITALLLAAYLLGIGDDAAAQSRSSTGRHRPEPQPTAPAAADTVPAPPRAPGWFLGVSGGAAQGSDLFSVDVVGGTPVAWQADARFSSDHFDAVLDGSAEFALFVGRRLSSRTSLRADVSWAGMGVAAEARTGQVGDVFRYDQVSMVNLGVGVEVRLVKTASHPYMGAGLILAKLSPDTAEDLAQTNLGGRLTLGYQLVVDRDWSLRLEGRVNRTGFALGDFVPQAAQTTQPELLVEGQDDLTTWSLSLGVQIEI